MFGVSSRNHGAENAPGRDPRFDNEVNLGRRSHLVLGLMFLLSAALIIAAARGDLWLDEIWSLYFARHAHSVLDVFVRFHHDNNHPLNTLFLYLAGERKSLFVYRLLAVLSGIGSVLLVGSIARKDWGYPEALCSVALAGTSYPLLLYFSEARGYAPAIFFALAAYALLRHTLQRFRLRGLLLFWAACILGMVSHATFIMVSIAFAAGGLAHEFRVAGPLRSKALRWTALQLPPLLFFAWWYMFFLKNMTTGGGPVYGTMAVIGQASALLLGFPDAPAFHVAAILSVLILIVLGANSLGRKRGMQGPFFFTVLLVSPALLLAAVQTTHLYFRYFSVCFPFFFLLLSYLFGRCYRLWPHRWRWLLYGAIVLVIAGQTQRDYLLLKFGRGDYAAALEYICQSSREGIVRLGTDHDFRNRMLFDFYAPRVAGGNKLRYVEHAEWPVEPPDWIITHSQEAGYRPPEDLIAGGVGEYRFIRMYRYAGVSGWNWYLYRRET